MKFDLHVHTENSIDSKASLASLCAAARKRGLSGFAVCDHNVFTHIPECDDLIIIPACEYSTDAGHMLTFFLKDELDVARNSNGKYPWREIVDAAKAQGALVFLAHPYSPKVKRDREVWQAIDGIEVFNARIEHSRIKDANIDAQTTCMLMKKPFSAGGDAHFPGEIGHTFWECDCEPTLPAIKEALKNGEGRVFAGVANPLYQPMSQWIKMRKQRNYKIIPKLIIRFIYAFLRFFTRKKAAYLNMKGAK